MRLIDVCFKNEKFKRFSVQFIVITILILIMMATANISGSMVEANNSSSTATGSRKSTFTTEAIYTIHGGSLAGGMVAGNFDNDVYQEFVVVGGSSEGEVSLIDYNTTSGKFDSHLLWWDPSGSLMDVVVGDLDDSNDNLEILVGGFSGNLTVLYYQNPGSVTNETIWNTSFQNNYTSKLIHIFGLAIGDIDPRSFGNEIAVADADKDQVYILTKNNNDWLETKLHLPDTPRNVYIGDFDSKHLGNELMVICVKGTVFCVKQENKGWEYIEMFKDSNAPMSAVIAEINASHPGDEVVVAGLSWNATLIWGSGAKWYNKTIWRSPGALEGMVYDDFDGNHDGFELCITGYSNTAVMLFEKSSEWYNEIIYHDPNPLLTELNGAIVGDFSPEFTGMELVLVGFTGNVTLLSYKEPDFKLSSPSVKKTVTARDSEFTTFQINLEVFSDYASDVELDLTGLPANVEFSFSRKILSGVTNNGNGQDTKSAVLTLDVFYSTIPGTYELTVVGTSVDDNRNRYLDLTLTIIPETEPYFILTVTPETIKLNLTKNEYIAEFDINIHSINQFNDTVLLLVEESFLNQIKVKNNLEIQFTPSSIKPDEPAKLNIYISKNLNESLEFEIPIYGENSKLNLKDFQTVHLEIIYFDTGSENGEDDSKEEIEFHQWLSFVLLLIVIVVLLSFIAKRARDLKSMDQKRRELKSQRPPGMPRGRQRDSNLRQKGYDRNGKLRGKLK